MRVNIPDEAYLSLPAEITPELARAFPGKMNRLLQVQLLGRSLGDSDAALNLLLDLATELVPSDWSSLLWADEAGGPQRTKGVRGSVEPAARRILEEILGTEEPRRSGRPFLLRRAGDSTQSPEAALQKLQAQCLLSLPVYVGEAVHGTLMLARTTGADFEMEEAHLLRVFTLAFEGILEGLVQEQRGPDLAYLDRLTGLFNRRYFEQQLEREVDRARRHGEVVSVVTLRVGDLTARQHARGHADADGLLREVARAMRRVVRKSDTLSRIAEDEFAAILPGTPKANLSIVAQRTFQALEHPTVNGSGDTTGPECEFSLCAVNYPEDAFSAESVLDASRDGLERAKTLPGKRYYQFPSPEPQGGDDAILDAARAGIMREPVRDPSGLLRLFTRLALDAVPADRVSVMIRDGEDLVIQVAVGFEGQDEIVRTTRVPLTRKTVSSWVAQTRKPLLVAGPDQYADLPVNGAGTYRGDSFFSYPLLHDGELVGLIHFSNRSDGQPFTEADVERFAPVATFLSQYVVLSRGFDRVQEDFLNQSLFGLVDLMESQVPGMAGHSVHVADLARSIARGLGCTEEAAQALWVTARLHNLGKVSYRTPILAEPRALSARERALTQRHTLLSWKFLEGLPLRNVDREAILYHHEREDGSGYLHKTGEDVPLNAKILAVADVYQALVSERPYRPALPPQEALHYMEANQGVLFDGRVVEVLRGEVGSH